ncbi:hypothetical protein ACEWPL_008975 [Roseovarius sp. S1116L3]|uniref:hypothetical protein n=1 Tax=Roseovarius roseus TaxID=3342636 RepID=UPI003727B8D9
MRAGQHIIAACLAALVLAGCAAPNQMESYVGRPIGAAVLDHGSPVEVFQLSDGRRAFQWELTKTGFRPSPQPRIGVGIGIGRHGWGGWSGGMTTLGTDYIPYSKTCRYTLIGEKRGDDWIVSEFRKPTPGCA